MAKIDDFREGARSGDPKDTCPNCKAVAPMLVYDGKHMGRHRLVACAACKTVFLDGQLAATLEVFGPHATFLA